MSMRPKRGEHQAGQTRKEIRTFWKRHGKAVLRYGLAMKGPRASTGVGANTYRAYGGFVGVRKSPSVLMENWVRKIFDEKNKLGMAANFEAFHKSALKSLVKYWNNNSGSNTKLKPVPYGTKLLDLQVKVCVWQQWAMNRSQRNRLLKTAFQPLDRNSLGLLKKLGIRKLNGNLIRAGASMGDVKSVEEYVYFQRAIRAECVRIGIPMFAFDYFAWNIGPSRDTD